MSVVKMNILEQHQANTDLNHAAPALMPDQAHDLSADEFSAPLDERIIAAAAEALDAGNTHYVDVPGIAPLRAAIAEYLRGAGLGDYQQGNVLVSAGMQESRFLTLQMIGAQFDGIALPGVVHPGVRRALGVRPLPTTTLAVDAKTGLPSVDSIRAMLTDGTRLLYLESPSRLTGAAYSAEQLEQIAQAVSAHDATVIIDQGLAAWTETYSGLAAIEGMSARTVVIGEAFPGSGLASWFIGYIAAPEALIAPMQSQKQIMAICTATASQYAALEASQLFAETRAVRLQQLAQQRQRVIDLLGASQVNVLSGGALNVLALRLPADTQAAALANLSSAGYSAADGADFGAPDVVRLTLTLDASAAAAIPWLT